MSVSQAEIKTSAGSYNAEIVTPEGAGPWPAVILFIDGGGARPALTQIAERIAKDGYLVAIPDLFHRGGAITKLAPEVSLANGISALFGAIFANDEKRQRFFTEFYGPALSYPNLETDIGALLGYLHGRSDVKPGPVGTTGYCMGGNASLRVATIFGDQIGATASFHGGGLVTDAPDSPHKRAKEIKSTVYVAGAIEDGSFTDDAKKTLIEALDAAHVKNTVETYPAKHGFAVPDHAGVYDAACAERHYEALSKLYAQTLK